MHSSVKLRLPVTTLRTGLHRVRHLNTRKTAVMTADQPQTIIKPPQDRKEYRHHVLSNGLTVLLISDPDINTDSTQDKTHAAQTDATKIQHEDEGSIEGSDDEDEEGDAGSESGSMDEDEESVEGESGSDEEDADEDNDGEDEEAGRRGKGAPAAAVKKAAAAMAVGVGSLSDPPHMQGLSHYLEHMLFMGSEKYPDENDYDDFITKHGGSSNAFTELEYTNYHFEVAPDALYGALDRFAQFFTAPLCLASSLEREVQAVDSEFSGVLQSDACRASQLMCHTARLGHPYRQFSWGNKKSLWDQPLAAGLDIRQQILDYYKKHYSAERMSLVVLGGNPLDTLQSWVEELFNNLPTGKGPRPSFEHMQQPFEGRQLYMMPAVRDHHEVSLTFQLPCMWRHYKSKAEQYVAHLVGHEGPGSLLSYLKAQGWATEVCAGIEEDGYSQNTGCFLFSVTITLTDAGLSAAPGCGLAVVKAAFQYLNMLRNAGPQEWVWREMAGIADIKFRFQEEEEAMDMTTKLASVLHLHPPHQVLVAEYLHEEYKPELINMVMSSVHATESSYRVDLLTRSYPELQEALSGLEGVDGKVTVDTEPWFNMQAAWVQIPDEMCCSWSKAEPPPEMHLPPPNPYIATDFTVKGAHAPDSTDDKTNGKPAAQSMETNDQNGAVSHDGKTSSEPAGHTDAEASHKAVLAQQLGLPLVLATAPQMVHDQTGLRVWHKLDRTFKVPRANVFFRLASPAWCDSPRAAALTHLALKLLEDCLTEDAYLAEVAGLHYSTAPEGMAGMEFKVDGFSHKLPVLAARLFGVLADATFDKASYAPVKEALLRKYRNMNMQVSKHANYQRLYALCAQAWHYTTLEPHIQAAELQDVVKHVRSALSSCHLEVFAHGNMDQQDAIAIATAAHTTIGQGCTMAAKQRTRDCCIALPEGTVVIHQQQARNKEEENCGVEVYYQVGVAKTPHQRALVDLVDQIVYEPAYNVLRTQQQLGYTVHTGTRLTHGVLGFCFVVVSASHTAPDVDKHIEAFIESFTIKLAEMSPEEFEQQKSALSANKLSRDRALADESVRHWDHIWNQRYDFFAREAEVAALQSITLQQVRDWWATYMCATSAKRRKLAVYVTPTKECPAAGVPDVERPGAMDIEQPSGKSKSGTINMEEDAMSPKTKQAVGSGPRKRAKQGTSEKRSGAKPQQKKLTKADIVMADDIDAFKAGCERFPQLLASEPPMATGL